MTLNINMNKLNFFNIRLGPGAIMIKKRRHNNKFMYKAYYRYESSSFSREKLEW